MAVINHAPYLIFCLNFSFFVGMDKLKAILVDDEESARDVLENLLLRFCPDVELLAKCENLPQAVETIRRVKPQLVFLDIEMPNYAGFEIAGFFPEPEFKIIFVTAYDKYAIRAFEVAAIDYLLKPIDIQRLKMAVERARKEFSAVWQNQSLPLLSETLESKRLNNIAVTDKGRQHIVPVDAIIAVEAQEAYSIIYTESRSYTVSKPLRHYETLFAALPNFIRTHKSWLINKNHLLSYSKSDLTIYLKGGIVAKLSKYRKAEFGEALLG